MKVGIVGLGLIGGSLGLDLRSLGYEILGISRRESTCKLAEELGVADRASVNFTLMSEADIIFICTPIAAIKPTVEQLIPHLKLTTIITDVGSVKAPIVEEISPLWSNFVGGHPMAGTEENGINAAQRKLFVDAPYVLTTTANTPTEAVKTVESIVRSLGSKIHFCSPQTHDRAVAWISHLPLIISANLISACLDESETEVLELAKNLASSGFRDTSRVGGGNPELGLMIAQNNQQELLKVLLKYRQSLDNLIGLIEEENWQELEAKLQVTQKERPTFLS